MASNTFTQALVIHRFLQLNELHRKKLAILFDEDENYTTTKIMKQGIKTYMENHVDKLQENCDNTNTINNIFSTIMNNFTNEYHLITTYQSRCTNITDNKHYYYNHLFNQSDLVQHIFQYLFCDSKCADLINCSFVDTIWLYNAFSPNCYQYPLDSFERD